MDRTGTNVQAKYLFSGMRAVDTMRCHGQKAA
jgi:hypothetical protein